MFEHVADLEQTDPELAAVAKEMRSDLHLLGKRLRVDDDERRSLAWVSALASMYATNFATTYMAYPGSEEKATAMIDAIQRNITEAMGQWLSSLPKKANGRAIYAPGD